VPGLAGDRFLGGHSLFLYPAGTGNAATRPTIHHRPAVLEPQEGGPFKCSLKKPALTKPTVRKALTATR
jgi:hypothetical protein